MFVSGKLKWQIVEMKTMKEVISPISEIDINAQVVEFEQSQNLFDFEVEGWALWPIIRFPFMLSLMKYERSKIRQINFKQASCFAFGDLGTFLHPPKSDVIVVTLSSARGECQDGQFKDIYFDDLLARFSSNQYFKMEQINNVLFASRGKNALIASAMTTVIPAVLARAKASFFGFPQGRVIAQEIAKLIATKFSENAFNEKKILSILNRFYASTNIYSRLFAKIRPKVLLTINGYCDHAMIAAAKKVNCRVLELQHGFVDRHHFGYSYSNSAAPFKARMSIPDQILLYGEFWKEELSASGFWDSELVSVGSPRVDSFRLQNITRNQDPLRLVVTTQGVETNNLIKFMQEFLAISGPTLPNMELVFKMHPVFESDKSIYTSRFGGDSRVKVLTGVESPTTFEIIQQSNFHLSISSSCHFESLGLGIPTVILPFQTHETVGSLVRLKHAYFADSPANLFEIVSQKRESVVDPKIRDFYFRSGAVANLYANISQNLF